MKGYLKNLEAERDAQKKKAEESTAAAKVPAWISLHMQVAEKRGSAQLFFILCMCLLVCCSSSYSFCAIGSCLGGVVWPLHIEPSLAATPWFKVLTDRTKEAGVDGLTTRQ